MIQLYTFFLFRASNDNRHRFTTVGLPTTQPCFSYAFDFYFKDIADAVNRKPDKVYQIYCPETQETVTVEFKSPAPVGTWQIT